jgi:hypothetical protein
LKGVKSAVSWSCLKPVGESAFGMFAMVLLESLARILKKEDVRRVEE